MYFAYTFVHFRKNQILFVHWASVSVILFCAGLPIHFLLFPMNRNLYSISYSLITGGICAIFLLFIYFVTEIIEWKKIFLPFLWLGMVKMKSLIFFFKISKINHKFSIRMQFLFILEISFFHT